MTSSARVIRPCPPGFSDHIFKDAHGVSIPLRIWPAPKSSATGQPRPWLLWIHGGGFQAGKHYIPNIWVHQAFSERGYHIVSTAYRYTPEVGMADQVEDCIDAAQWCRTSLPPLLGSDNPVDLDRLVVGGDSAGGTLTTLLGHHLSPAPRALVNCYGVVDLTEPAYYKPVDRSILPPLRQQWDEKLLDEALDIRDPTKAVIACPWDWELPPNMDLDTLRSFWGTPDFTPDEATLLRTDSYRWATIKGKRFFALFRGEECNDAEELKARATKWSSLYLLDGKTAYPPTFVMHGMADSVVKIEQSYRFVKKLEQFGVPVQAVYCPEGLHTFDQSIDSPDALGWNEFVVPCMDFVDHHVKK